MSDTASGDPINPRIIETVDRTESISFLVPQETIAGRRSALEVGHHRRRIQLLLARRPPIDSSPSGITDPSIYRSFLRLDTFVNASPACTPGRLRYLFFRYPLYDCRYPLILKFQLFTIVLVSFYFLIFLYFILSYLN